MKNLILIMTIICASFTSAQIEATTDQGKKVTLHDNGTWEFKPKEEVKENESFECSDFVETKTDKMTGKKSASSKNTLIVSKDGGKNGLGIILLDTGKGSIILNIKAVGAGNCIDEGTKMNVLFTDGTRFELKSDGKFNCKGDYTVYFGKHFGRIKQLKQFASKDVETIRVWTSSGFVEEDFTKQQAHEFKQTVKCISKLQ